MTIKRILHCFCILFCFAIVRQDLFAQVFSQAGDSALPAAAAVRKSSLTIDTNKVLLRHDVLPVVQMDSNTQNQQKPDTVIPKAVIADTVRAVAPVNQMQTMEIPAGILFGQFDRESGPICIKGSLIVPAGQTLTFGPGCVINIDGDYTTITVFGQIIAKGTEKEPVVFQSAKSKANPWDWDRIYVRSRNRSTFEHCIVRNANYGIMVENGSALVDHCRFEHNSIHGLVAKNSDVTVLNTTFTGGHVLALVCDAGADVQAESLFVNNNISGIAVAAKGSLQLHGGNISRNSTGIVAASGSSVSIIAADVTKNRVGLVSGKQVPKKMAEMIYGNALDLQIGSQDEIAKLLKSPEAVATVVLGKSSAKSMMKDDFSPGFSALGAPREATTSFIGTVTTGFSYFDPLSTIDSLRQNHYPGEQSPGRSDNFQPEMQLFANGKRDGVDVALLLDIYGNEWTGLKRNNTSLTLTYADQVLALGDFYESGSETSISGRKLTGIKLDGKYFEMGRGEKRLGLKLAFGQSEVPKECGNHELDLYNTNIDSGMSIRQQLTYVAGVTINPTMNSSIGVHGLIARDQGYKTFIGGEVVEDPKAPDLVQAQTGCVDGRIDLLNGKLTVNAELDVGVSDTLNDTVTADKDKIDKIVWYDPQYPDAMSKVFSVFSTRKNYAFTIGATSTVDGYRIGVTGMQLAPSFFAAGNPYLEVDRRDLAATVENDFSEKLSASLSGDYQRRTLSVSPVGNTLFHGMAKYAAGQFLPEFAGDYTFNYETSSEHQNTKIIDSVNVATSYTASHFEDLPYTVRDMKNCAGIEIKQQFANDMDYSLKYQLLLESDLTKYIDSADMNKRNSIQHQVSARYGFKIGKGLRNRTTVRLATKNNVLDSLRGVSYKVSDELKLVLVPRKLFLNMKGEYGDKVDKKVMDTTSGNSVSANVNQQLRTLFAAFETEVKYTFSAKWSLVTRGRYEKSSDDTPGSRENYLVKIFSFNCTYLF